LGKSDRGATLGWLSAQQTEWLLLFNGADNIKKLGLHRYLYFPQARRGNIIITTQNPELCIHAPQSHFYVTSLSPNEAKALLLEAAGLREDADGTAEKIVHELG
jgi:hypothetical protein